MNSFSQKLKKSLPRILAMICGTTSLLSAIAATSSFAVASQSTANQHSSVNNQVLANAYTCPRYAGGGLLEAYVETPNFYIYICNKRGQLYYTSTSKLNRQGIRSLPVYVEEGTGYVAKNGKYEYIVDGTSLTILKNGHVLQTDPVIQYISGYAN